MEANQLAPSDGQAVGIHQSHLPQSSDRAMDFGCAHAQLCAQIGVGAGGAFQREPECHDDVLRFRQ